MNLILKKGAISSFLIVVLYLLLSNCIRLLNSVG